MTNAETILTTLDRKLDHPVRLILYGRAAIQLGFRDAPEDVAQSKDVDGILPMSDIESIVQDSGFWDAVEAVNTELREQNLYITHLFQSDQVFLRRQWEDELVALEKPQLHKLQLYRPATLDLILTKMMRGDDPQDMEDITFMVQHDSIGVAQIEHGFRDVIIPDLAELREAFEMAKPLVRKIVNRLQ